MKNSIGLFLLFIVLVAASGCTQQAKPAQVTTAPTTAVTAVATPVETTVVTTVATPVPTTEIMANVTMANMTPPVSPTELPSLTQAPTATMTPSTTVTVIHIVNNTFTPATLMVLPGTSVTWRNDDTIVHSVMTTGDHAGMFKSGDLIPGAQFSFSFGANQGTYAFADGYYPNVTGSIIVQNGAPLVGGVIITPTTTS